MILELRLYLLNISIVDFDELLRQGALMDIRHHFFGVKLFFGLKCGNLGHVIYHGSYWNENLILFIY